MRLAAGAEDSRLLTLTTIRAAVTRLLTSGALGLISRFGLAGLLNTAFGFSIIAGLELGLGLQRNVANAAGYAAATVMSYLLNRNFVFRGAPASGSTIVRFVAAQAVSFAVNQGMLVVAAQLLGDSSAERMAAQAIAMISYTTFFFLLCKLWVFAPPGRSRPESEAQP